MDESIPILLRPAMHSYVLDIPYSARLDAMKCGVTWDKKRRVWLYAGETLPADLAAWRAKPYSYEAFIENEINGHRLGASKPTRNITLHDHQADAVSLINKCKRVGRVGHLLGDETGLGKTLSVWKAVAMMRDVRTVLVVSPLSVTANWRQTIQWIGDHGKTIVVINYERLAKLFTKDAPASSAKKPGSRRRKTPSRKALAHSGKPLKFDVVVFDESHKLKNPDALRSRFARRLASKAKFRIWMSATAGVNPLDLNYLSPLLAQMTGQKVSDLNDFEEWCRDQNLGVTRGAFGAWHWNDDPEALKRVERLLFGGAIPAGLRRRPEDIAGWPEVNRILWPIDLGPAEISLYLAAWSDFRRQLRLERTGAKEAKANALVARLRFRQKSSLLRIDGTLELVRSQLEEGRQVAVSVAFVETLEAMKRKLERENIKVSCIYGAQSADERETERLAFQTGERPVVLFTPSEGISLHQGEHNDVPRSEIIHDVRWSAIEMAQTEGRCHRDGRYAPVFWVYAPDAIEHDIARTVAGRIASMKAMQGDDPGTVRAIEEMLKAYDLGEAGEAA